MQHIIQLIEKTSLWHDPAPAFPASPEGIWQKIKLKKIEKSHKITDKKKIPIKKSILKHGFNYGLGYIIIDNKNRIIDGHHRYQSLLEIKGGESEILVKKSNFTFSL